MIVQRNGSTVRCHFLRIIHPRSGAVLAEGPLGWGITPFDGGLYIRRRHLRAGRFTAGLIPGLCPYKGLYVSMNYHAPDGIIDNGLAWLYALPNPLFPFIWFRVALPRVHPNLEIVEYLPSEMSAAASTPPPALPAPLHNNPILPRRFCD